MLVPATTTTGGAFRDERVDSEPTKNALFATAGLGAASRTVEIACLPAGQHYVHFID
ncbi:MAG: hypothetical protein ACRELB_02720 [Polyangiaceae bacterium]